MTSGLLLNGFKVELSSRTFVVYVREMRITEGLSELRNRFGQSWLVH